VTTIISSRANTTVYHDTISAKALEVIFFVYLVYSGVSVPLGIHIPYLAAGMLILMAIFSLIKSNWKNAFRIPMILITAVVATFMIVQIIMYSTNINSSYMQNFMSWGVSAMVIFGLSGRRGFIKRLAVVMFLISLILRPFTVTSDEILTRVTLDAGTSLDSGNSLAAWQGFCALVFWMLSIKEKRWLIRILFWGAAFVSTVFLMQTISRGALLSLIVAVVLGLRSIPIKKWLGSVVILTTLVFFLITAFPTLVINYEERLYLETGRGIIWPIAINTILAYPLLGIGIDTVTSHTILPISPHNGIFLIWLASGIVPALLFIWLWILSIYRAFKAKWLLKIDLDPLPLILFTFMEMNQTNIAHYMSFWAIATVFYCFKEKPIIKIQKNKTSVI
jgi:O-antigen ligase